MCGLCGVCESVRIAGCVGIAHGLAGQVRSVRVGCPGCK